MTVPVSENITQVIVERVLGTLDDEALNRSTIRKRMATYNTHYIFAINAL